MAFRAEVASMVLNTSLNSRQATSSSYTTSGHGTNAAQATKKHCRRRPGEQVRAFKLCLIVLCTSMERNLRRYERLGNGTLTFTERAFRGMTQ
jgi:hypothetical protein